MSLFHVKVNKEALQMALSKVSCALGDKNDQIAGRSFSFSSDKKKGLTVVASRESVNAKYSIPLGDDLEIVSEGKIVLEGLPLMKNVDDFHTGVLVDIEDLNKNSGDEGVATQVQMSYENKNGKTWTHVHSGYSVEDYFHNIEMKNKSKVKLEANGALLLDYVDKVAFAAFEENFFQSYRVVSLDYEEDGFSMKASDGCQMTYIKDSQFKSEEKHCVLIEAKTLARILSPKVFESSENIEVTFPSKGGKKITFEQGNFVVESNFYQFEEGDDENGRLEYETLIELSDVKCKLSLAVGSLKEDLRALSPMGKSQYVNWHFDKKSLKLVDSGFNAKNTEGEIAAVSNFEGEKCKLKMDLRYWNQILSKAKCPDDSEIEVEIYSEEMPIRLKLMSDPVLYEYFIMPVIEQDI